MASGMRSDSVSPYLMLYSLAPSMPSWGAPACVPYKMRIRADVPAATILDNVVPVQEGSQERLEKKSTVAQTQRIFIFSPKCRHPGAGLRPHPSLTLLQKSFSGLDC